MASSNNINNHNNSVFNLDYATSFSSLPFHFSNNNDLKRSKVRNWSGSYYEHSLLPPTHYLPQISPLHFYSRSGSPRTVEKRKQHIRQIMEADFEENLFHVKSLTAKKCVKFFGTSNLPPEILPQDADKVLCAGCSYPVDAHNQAANQVSIKPWTRDTLKWRGTTNTPDSKQNKTNKQQFDLFQRTSAFTT